LPLLEVFVELPDPPGLPVTPLLVTPLEVVAELELGEDEEPPLELDDVPVLPEELGEVAPPLLLVAATEF